MSNEQADAANAGKNLQDPKTMSQTQNQEVAPAEGITDFGSMFVRQIRGSEYRVLSLKDNGQESRVYTVDVDALTCDCPDTEYRTEDGDVRVCKHIAKALYQAPKTRDVGDDIVAELGRMHSTIASAARDVQDATSTAEGILIKSRDVSAGSSTNDRPEGEATAVTAVDPAEAADKLQMAYNDVVEDMNVQHSEGYVWVQTGKDTPETLPGPGNVSVFDAFLKNAEQIEYIHDDHDDVDMKPGEWWKNRIDPSDVDDYINEVLH